MIHIRAVGGGRYGSSGVILKAKSLRQYVEEVGNRCRRRKEDVKIVLLGPMGHKRWRGTEGVIVWYW